MDSSNRIAKRIIKLALVLKKMKVKKVYIWLILITVLISSCDYETIRPSGEVTTREISIENYNSLKVSSFFKAHVFFSDSEEKVTIEANNDLHNKVVVENINNTLVVKLKNGINIKGKATLNVYITAKNIDNYDISGAADIVLHDQLVTKTVKIGLSGASTFNGEVAAEKMKLNAVGASKIKLFGDINNLDASLSGASEILSYDLIVKNIDIKISGASDASLTITESIKVNASGASVFKYKGNATIVSQKISGQAKVLKKD